MLLYGGLAQHILIELCQRWDNHLESVVEGQKDKVVENILTLMRAEGVTETKINLAKSAPTIGAMLESFAVGTERMKLAIPPLPDPNELIPLRKLKLDSTTAKAKAVLNPAKKSRTEATCSDEILILKKNTGTDTLEPISCDFCSGPIKTRHVCRFKGGNRRIGGGNENICGKAMCVECKGEEDEDRCLCRLHKNGATESVPAGVTGGATVDASAAKANIEEETIGTFIPNYVDVYTSCVAIPGFSFDKCEIPGFQLVKLRAERTLTEMGTRLVNTVVNDKKHRWRKGYC